MKFNQLRISIFQGLTENSRFTKPMFYAAYSVVFIDV